MRGTIDCRGVHMIGLSKPRKEKLLQHQNKLRRHVVKLGSMHYCLHQLDSF
uniref:Uncharacterized protein n=1 Tax=Arundo donax TaxID=35708 RepID=A0A0A9TUX4_ARUDO